VNGATYERPGGSSTVTPDWRTNLQRARRSLGSVRVGLVLLGLLLACCMIGMLVMQQEMSGFAEYYASLTPAQQRVYGALGLFDIYGSWYFAALLVATGVNIVVASIDRFPAAWRYLSSPKLTASRDYLRHRAAYREVEVAATSGDAVRRVVEAWREQGLKPRATERGGRTTVFAERHAWNRLGAYVVHVALLAIFAGGFMTSQFAVSGVVVVEPGSSTDVFVAFEQDLDKQRAREYRLPFHVACTDIQQQLLDPAGGLEPSNTLDWLSRVSIADETGERDALIHLNEPLDHKSYRLFQSSFEPEGTAREVVLSLESTRTGAAREVTVRRNAGAEVDGVGLVELVDFYPDFQLVNGSPATRSGEYANPVAQLRVTTPAGKARQLLAFGPEATAANFAGEHGSSDAQLVAGEFKVTLVRFEKVSRSHMLRVQYDPGKDLVYAGFALLVVSLGLIFGFSHERYWALVEPSGDGAKVHVGGDTNRNAVTLNARFEALADSINRTGSEQ
jgi:cytochrome c biogenesis protein